MRVEAGFVAKNLTTTSFSRSGRSLSVRPTQRNRSHAYDPNKTKQNKTRYCPPLASFLARGADERSGFGQGARVINISCTPAYA